MLEREGASWSLIPSSNTFLLPPPRLRSAPSSPHNTLCRVCWGCSLPCLPPPPALLSRLWILFTESWSFLSLSFPRTCVTLCGECPDASPCSWVVLKSHPLSSRCPEPLCGWHYPRPCPATSSNSFFCLLLLWLTIFQVTQLQKPQDSTVLFLSPGTCQIPCRWTDVTFRSMQRELLRFMENTL